MSGDNDSQSSTEDNSEHEISVNGTINQIDDASSRDSFTTNSRINKEESTDNDNIAVEENLEYNSSSRHEIVDRNEENDEKIPTKSNSNKKELIDDEYATKAETSCKTEKVYGEKSIAMKAEKKKRDKGNDHRLKLYTQLGEHGETTNARLSRAIKTGHTNIKMSYAEKENIESNENDDKENKDIEQMNNDFVLESNRSKRKGLDDDDSELDDEESDNFKESRRLMRSTRTLSSSSSSTSTTATLVFNDLVDDDKENSIENDVSIVNTIKLKCSSQSSISNYYHTNMNSYFDGSDSDNQEDEDDDEKGMSFRHIFRSKELLYDQKLTPKHYFEALNRKKPVNGHLLEEESISKTKTIPLETKHSRNLRARIENDRHSLVPDKNFVTEDWDDDFEEEASRENKESLKVRFECGTDSLKKMLIFTKASSL